MVGAMCGCRKTSDQSMATLVLRSFVPPKRSKLSAVVIAYALR